MIQQIAHIFSSTFAKLSRAKWLCTTAAALLMLSALVLSPAEKALYSPEASAIIAYDIDYEMDEARKEKTIEHYGEGIRDIVEDATANNVNNPESKPTAENSYEREGPLNDVLPKQIGKDFSKKELANMENSD